MVLLSGSKLLVEIMYALREQSLSAEPESDGLADWLIQSPLTVPLTVFRS